MIKIIQNIFGPNLAYDMADTTDVQHNVDRLLELTKNVIGNLTKNTSLLTNF